MQRQSISARALSGLTAVALFAGVGCRTVSTPETTAAHASLPPAVAPPVIGKLAGGAASLHALVDQFLAALADKDLKRLDQLSVSEAEYRDFILPTSVAPGQPLKVFPDQPSKYFWDVMNTKSHYWLSSIVAGYGGRKLTRKQIAYALGVQEYAGYRAYKKLVITVVNENGEEDRLHTGSVAEADRQYKFISYLGKD